MRPKPEPGKWPHARIRSPWADSAFSRVCADLSASSSDDVDETGPGELCRVHGDVAQDDELVADADAHVTG